MNTNTPHTPIHETVEKAILDGKVTMRSSLHFVLRSIGIVLLLIGIAFLSSIIVNFIVFSIALQSHHELLGFGVRGALAFLSFFPWLLFAIDIALVGLVLHLIQSFRFGYKTPTLYLILMLVCCTLTIGFAIERSGTPLNTLVMDRTEFHQIPPPLMRMMGIPPPRGEKKRPLCHCEVVEVRGGGSLFARDTRTGVMYEFRIRNTSPYATTSKLMPGDLVVIAGNFDGDGDDDDVIDTYGLKKIHSASPE